VWEVWGSDSDGVPSRETVVTKVDNSL
jgi:hypothetical protein